MLKELILTILQSDDFCDLVGEVVDDNVPQNETEDDDDYEERKENITSQIFEEFGKLVSDGNE
jgi:hypothetical protein